MKMHDNISSLSEPYILIGPWTNILMMLSSPDIQEDNVVRSPQGTSAYAQLTVLSDTLLGD